MKYCMTVEELKIELEELIIAGAGDLEVMYGVEPAGFNFEIKTVEITKHINDDDKFVRLG